MHSKKEYIKELTLEKKLVLFTSNFQGGIIQFTMHLATVLSKLNFDVIVFIPNNAKNIEQKNNAI